MLRTRLDAISDESAATIERTAISPVVTESKDYSATVLDGEGNLVTGGGRIEYHFGAAMNAVRSTIARHGATIRPGDVFLANDPHNGGGLHAQDVMVQQPVFVGDEMVAWVVNSAHLMDMGGMVMGSWAPAATECYQEAIRFPPVRLFREGVEEPDVFAIFRNNVRLSELVEMDLRALVAGCHVAEEKLIEVVQEMGVPDFRAGMRALCDSGERELRRRIEAIADGEYRTVTWTEWGDELYAVPCTLTVAGDTLVFDFTGASPQAPHFFNSKPYIIESELVADVCTLLVPGPAVLGRAVPPVRPALPRRLDRELGATGTRGERAHGRRVLRRDRGDAVHGARARGLARRAGAPVPERSVGHIGPRDPHVGLHGERRVRRLGHERRLPARAVGRPRPRRQRPVLVPRRAPGHRRVHRHRDPRVVVPAPRAREEAATRAHSAPARSGRVQAARCRTSRTAPTRCSV